MASKNDTYDQELENEIVDAVKRIKINRNRPCYDSIHAKLTKAGRVIQIEDVKVFIENLVKNGVFEKKIVVKENEEYESFSLVEGQKNDENGETVAEKNDVTNTVQNICKSHIDETFRLFRTQLLNDVEEKLNGFCARTQPEVAHTPINRVNKVNKSTLNQTLNTSFQRSDDMNETLRNTTSNSTCDVGRDTTNSLLDALYAEINFLRSEVNSKDEIIKILASERKSNVTDVTHSKGKVVKDVDDISTKNNNINNNITKKRTSRSGSNCNVNNNNNVAAGGKSKTNNDKTNKLPRQQILSSSGENSCDEDDYGDFLLPKKKKKSSRKVTIVGDSIVKNIRGYELNKKVAENTKTYVRSESGATVEDMTDYIKPTVRYNPDLIIIHCGTNDLRLRSAEEIATDVIGLAVDVKNEENEVALSSLIVRNDKYESKRMEVNELIKRMCNDTNLAYVDNSNIKKVHLNNSGLHLNIEGEKILKKNLINFINL